MFRNEEFKSIIIRLIIFQLILALMGFIIVNLFLDNINEKIILRDMSMVGNIVKDYPELQDKIIPYISKDISEENLALGKSTLKDYGYSMEIEKYRQPILKNISPNTQIITLLLLISLIIPLGLIVAGEYKKIYKRVNNVSAAAEKVVEGDFSIYLNEEGEGDFYILNHQINQMANRLENTLNILKREKTFLKDTISDISHQLKTPLSSLIMLNDILLEDKNMDSYTRKKFLKKTSEQLDRMEWLIINLLKLARIEAGAIEFKKEKVLLKDVVDGALKALDFKLEEQSINIEGNMDGFFYGDIGWTTEAVINIIKNAGEHSKGEIGIRLEDTPLFSTIIIKDNGGGIDEKDLPHIFKRFYKSNSDLKTDSIGIGLNLAKLIIESQEGTISVKSEKNKGTELAITFLKSGENQKEYGEI